MGSAWKKEIKVALKRAALPGEISGQIIVAPARGTVETFRDRVTYFTENGPRDRIEQSPYGAAVRVQSALSAIEAKSRNRKNPLVFTDRHHQAASEYEALFLRVNSGRVKCSDLQGSGGGGGMGVTDQIIHDIQRLRKMDQRIGRRPILLARGAQARAGRRTLFTDELMFDALIRQAPLGMTLQARQWPNQSRYIKTLQTAIMSLLDAIYGV